MKNQIPEPKKDEIGLFYDSLPKEFRLASIDDFHNHGKKRIGMTYIVQWNDQVRFSIREVNESLTGKKIIPFIKANKVFVLKN